LSLQARLEAWESVFRDDPCCEGGQPGTRALAAASRLPLTACPSEPARVADALLALRGSERIAVEEAKEAARRCGALSLRGDAAEAEVCELRAALHSTLLPRGRTAPSDDATLLLDRGAVRELTRLSALVASQRAALAQRDEEIQALSFNKESKQGRMLMARVRTLIKENEEFGAQLSEGRMHSLEQQVGLLKHTCGDLKRTVAELQRTLAALNAENEELQVRAFGRPAAAGEAAGAAAARDAPPAGEAEEEEERGDDAAEDAPAALAETADPPAKRARATSRR